MSKIYLASSWRNDFQQDLVQLLRQDGHEVYDYRNPPAGTGFSWDQVGYDTAFISKRDVLQGDLVRFREALDHPRAIAGFESDFSAMKWADTFVLLLPCGRSAHLEAGWAVGAGKPVHVLLNDRQFEPELMYLLCAQVHTESRRLRAALGGPL